MADREEKQVEKKEVFSAEEMAELKRQLDEQGAKLRQYEEEMKAQSAEYKKKLEEVSADSVKMRKYQPLGMEKTPISADDFMMKLADDARQFEEVYGFAKRYRYDDPYESLVLRIRTDLEQGIPWEHVRRIYKDELAKYNIV